MDGDYVPDKSEKRVGVPGPNEDYDESTDESDLDIPGPSRRKKKLLKLKNKILVVKQYKMLLLMWNCFAQKVVT